MLLYGKSHIRYSNFSEFATRAVSTTLGSNKDFHPPTTTLVQFNSNAPSAEATVNINSDVTTEAPETFEVSIANPSTGRVVSPFKAVVTILDISITSKH